MTSTLYVDNLEPNLGSRVTAAGHVIQVVQGEFGTTASAATADAVSVDTGLEATITPTSANSKILIQYSVFLGSANAYNVSSRIVRGSTQLGNGTQEGSRPVANAMYITYTGSTGADPYHISCLSNSYLDAPSTTSATTYKIQMGKYGNQNVYINRSANFQNQAGYDTIPLSTITLMEIAQ